MVRGFGCAGEQGGHLSDYLRGVISSLCGEMWVYALGGKRNEKHVEQLVVVLIYAF